MTTLRLGSATADITPDWSLTLAGFAARTEPSRGVSQPLQVQASVLESSDTAGNPGRAVVVTGDLIWWGAQEVDSFRADIAKRAGTGSEMVLLSATHTHSGPQTSVRASHEIGVVDPRYTALLRQQVLAATTNAVSKLEPVSVSRVTGACDLAFNRRDDRYPTGSVDPALTVIRFKRPDGSLATFWVHFTCHPVITQEPLISSEFCGVAMAQLRHRYGVPALYLQGCCGDINPVEPGESRSLRGTDVEVVQAGTRLAAAVEDLLAAGPVESLAPIPLAATTRAVDVPFADLPTETALHAQASRSDVLGELAQALLTHPEWRIPTIPLTLQRLDIARGLSLLAMNGEVVVDYGLRIRQWSDGTVLPLGYANGMTGYIPTARIIAEGGYEAGEAAPYFLLPGGFDPAVETIVNEAIATLVRG